MMQRAMQSELNALRAAAGATAQQARDTAGTV